MVTLSQLSAYALNALSCYSGHHMAGRSSSTTLLLFNNKPSTQSSPNISESEFDSFCAYWTETFLQHFNLFLHSQKVCVYYSEYTVVPPYPWVIHSKTYSGYAKPQIIPNALYNVIFV
jgi:hypothetical protein